MGRGYVSCGEGVSYSGEACGLAVEVEYEVEVYKDGELAVIDWAGYAVEVGVGLSADGIVLASYVAESGG